jgi:hypothetical protein
VGHQWVTSFALMMHDGADPVTQSECPIYPTINARSIA